MSETILFSKSMKMSSNEAPWYRKRVTGVKLQRYWQVAVGATILFGAVVVPAGFSYWTDVIQQQKKSSMYNKDDMQRLVLERRQDFRRILKDCEAKNDSNTSQSSNRER